MQFVLVDMPQTWANLKPLTLTRPISHIRVGIFTIAEKWANYANLPLAYLTQPYLQTKYALPAQADQEAFFVNGAVCPHKDLWQAIKQLELNSSLVTETGEFLACRAQVGKASFEYFETIFERHVVYFNSEITCLRKLTDIFAHNGKEIQADFQWIKTQRKSLPIEDKHTIVYNPDNVFIEEGAHIKASVLDASKGVIYIGKNAEVQIGSMIQGNFALCEGAVINVGGKMRPDTTIGAYCKVGGEISNSVLIGYSNKGHDGFLGNSVLGEWCNLGADTNTSNLKNNYSNIRIWNYPAQDYVDTGKQFCGLMMGDHSKAGINTMFNTGTVVGVCANIFGSDFPPKYIPSFAWGGDKNSPKFELEKAFEVAQRVMERRGKILTEAEKNILTKISGDGQ
jgi:UDP-N-acetylglucosamine diphosphorylase/glucosamine-1-phosphate N-acetyltransferase